MAAFDAISSTSDLRFTTITQSHTCSAANRILLVWVVYRNDLTAPTAAPTYDGVSTTLVNTWSLGDITIKLYSLSSPNAGTADIVLHLSSSDGGQLMIAASFKDSSGLLGVASNTTWSTGSPRPSISVGSSVGDLIVDIITGNFTDNSTSPTPDASQTQQANVYPAAQSVDRALISTKAGAATSTTMAWTNVLDALLPNREVGQLVGIAVKDGVQSANISVSETVTVSDINIVSNGTHIEVIILSENTTFDIPVNLSVNDTVTVLDYFPSRVDINLIESITVNELSRCSFPIRWHDRSSESSGIWTDEDRPIK